MLLMPQFSKILCNFILSFRLHLWWMWLLGRGGRKSSFNSVWNILLSFPKQKLSYIIQGGRKIHWSLLTLVISNFLEEISSLSHSVLFLYFFALIADEGFLISSCYSLELCIQMLISFFFSLAFCFSSFHSYFCLFVSSFFLF